MPNPKLKQIVDLIKNAEGVTIGALVDQMNLVIKDNNTTRSQILEVASVIKELRDTVAISDDVAQRFIALENDITALGKLVDTSSSEKISKAEKKLTAKIDTTLSDLRDEIVSLIPEQFDPSGILSDIEEKTDIKNIIKGIKEEKLAVDDIDGLSAYIDGKIPNNDAALSDLRKSIEIVDGKIFKIPAGVEIFDNGRNLGRFPSINFKNGTIVPRASGVDITLPTGGGSGTPGGSNGSIQYNNTGTFDGFGSYNGATLDITGKQIISAGITTAGIFYQYGDAASFDVSGSSFSIKTTTYTNFGLLYAGDGGLVTLGDFFGDGNSTYIGIDDSALSKTITYNAVGGHIFTGNVSLGTYQLTVHNIRPDATDGLLIESNNGTDIGLFGASNTANVTWYGNHNFNNETANTIAGFGATKTLGSLSTATYPDLTELSYVKGVTSSIQTQISNKQPLDAQLTDLATLSYTGNALKVIRVNAGETGFELASTSGFANTSLSNLSSVAINTTLLPGSNDGAALGSGTLAFSDIFLASGAVVNFNNGNVTITHTAGTLTLNNTAIALGSGALTTTGNVSGNSWLGSTAVRAGSTSVFYWNTKSQMSSPFDGKILFTDSATTGFLGVLLGGTTTAYPYIKRNGAAINFRLADDSADAAITALSYNKVTITAPTTSATLTLADGSTLATSGAFSTTLTATAATNVTLPTTGTLATLAGSESLTNKKLGSLTSNGFVKTSGGDGTLSVDTTSYSPTYTPAFIGYHATPNSAASIGSANRMYVIAVTIPQACTLTKMAYVVGTSSGNVDVAVYNNSGTRLGSSGSVACPASGAAQTSFTSNITISTPGIYYLALSVDNNTATFERFGVDPIVGVNYFDTSFPAPSSVTLPGTVGSRCVSLVAIVSGGITQ